MRRAMQTMYRLIKTLMRIERLEVEKSLKSKIRATWYKVFFLKRYDSENRVATIVGFEVRFLDYGSLTNLFDELFLYNQYYFVADNDSPYIVDCGSNIGMSIFYFHMLYPNSRIVAFEPGEEPYCCLEENVATNLLNSVTTYKAALANREGNIELYYDQDNVGSLRMSVERERMPPKQSRSVEAVLLSRHIDEEVDFLKMDIEGAELEVIEELSKADKLRYIKQMVIEYHHHVVRESDVFSRILKLLEDAGFGYQINGHLGRPLMREQFQDIMVYAYRKK